MMQMQYNFKAVNRYNKKEISLISYGVALFWYIIYLTILFRTDSLKNYNALVYLFNWAGIFAFSYIVFSWKRLTNHIFTPYLIFMSFFFVFHYGQPIMWSVGIHIPNEIGERVLYPGLSIPTSADILHAQALVIVSILMFHFGAILSHKKLKFFKKKLSSNEKKFNSKNVEDTRSLKSIFYACIVIGLISVPLQLFISFRDFRIASDYGYKALHYSEFASSGASIYSVFLFMFFPCLIGLLIGSKFNKKVRIFVYIVFGLYAVLNLLAGDRGSWLYKMIILLWLSHVSYKPIDVKKLFKYSILGIMSLYLVYAIISVRDVGITMENIRNSLTFENSPIITAFFEMGGSMKPMMVLQKYGWDIWPHGNTYLLAITGMVSNRVFDVLDIPFELLSSFFSQNYLGLSWGAGFSIVAEALLNFGPYFTPLFMIFLGWLITTIIDIDMNVKYTRFPGRFLFAIASLESLISINRNVIHIPIKTWFYSAVLLCLIIGFVRKFIIKGPSCSINHLEERNNFAKNY